MIAQCTANHFNEIYTIINDAATAYKGVIPGDRYHEPYMPEAELQMQINQGVVFWGYRQNDTLLGVMGIQDKGEVVLIRHAYVRPAYRGHGIGGKLLAHLVAMAKTPILIGTWADAKWAIAFYEKHGFSLTSYAQKELLLRKYWAIPARQIETSVVLASADWKG
jgi:GNAT superfamily N-acetyltransferase